MRCKRFVFCKNALKLHLGKRWLFGRILFKPYLLTKFYVMRKNLFLTLALIVASIATVNAQWSQVFTRIEGLPGSVVPEKNNCVVYETGLITPDAPISGLRWTVLETQLNQKPDGHPCVAVNEFTIFDAAGNKIAYQATGNSYIAESLGWPALNDGSYEGYFHTNWGGNNPTGDYHFIEFEFDAPVSEFSIEWAIRGGAPENYPTIVVLTEKDVYGADKFQIPESTYSLGSQITSLEALLAAGYVSMEAETFKGDWSKDVTGWLGARFFTAPNALVISDSIQNYNAGMAMQIVPAEKDGEYYLYWPETGRYFGRNNLTSTLAQNDGCKFVENGAGATNTGQAAALTITPNNDGTFTMSFTTPEGDLAYLCADPRTEKGIKSVNELFKAQNDAKDYTAGFGYPCAFNFKFYNAEYTKSDFKIKLEVVEPLKLAKELSATYGGAQGSEADCPQATTHADMMANVAKAEAIIAGGTVTAAEATALVSDLQENIIWYLYTVAYEKLLDAYALYEELPLCPDDAPVNGYYTEGSWNNTVGAILTSWLNDGCIAKVDLNGPLYSYYNEFVSSIAALEQAFETFYAGKISFVELPLFYGEADGLPGVVSGIDTRTWTSPSIRFQSPIDGFRITFARSANPNGNVIGSQDRAVVLGELIIMDADGNRIPMSGDMVVTNAIEQVEGSLAGLFDGEFDANGNLTTNIGDFYHSPWKDSYGWDSNEYIYFDITLPESMDGIKFTFHSRTGNKSFNPADICVGVYGEVYDPIAALPNTYNASVGAQVTDASQITDWGVYAIQGLINTNPNSDAVAEPIEPNWYAGEQPFHNSVVREHCAYFFTKNSDGTFKIMSIGESKFWTAGGGLSSYSTEAANVHIVPSTNADFAGENTLVLYTDVKNPQPVEASHEYIDEESGAEIIVDPVEVTCPYTVLMDWGTGYGLAARQCIDFQPGVNPENYGDQAASVEVLLEYPNLLAATAAGDNLHFNKTSGEGEWKIYKLSMENPFYYWATALATIADGLGFIEGENPGEYSNLGSYASDLAALQSVVENNNYAGAESAAKKFASTIEALTSGNNAKNPVVAGVYAIVCDARGGGHYLTINDNDEVIGVQAGEDAMYDEEYQFHLEAPYNIEDLYAEGELSIDQSGRLFSLKHVATGKYIIGGDGTSNPISLGDDAEQAGPFLFNGGASNYFTMGKWNNYEGYNQLHLDGGLKVVSWNGEPTAASASGWRLIKISEDPTTSIDDLVAEGSEVVSVKYYTAGGAESAAPVKGLNIVTIVYSNGVTETKKVAVE